MTLPDVVSAARVGGSHPQSRPSSGAQAGCAQAGAGLRASVCEPCTQSLWLSLGRKAASLWAGLETPRKVQRWRWREASLPRWLRRLSLGNVSEKGARRVLAGRLF